MGVPKILSFDLMNSIFDLYKSGKSSTYISNELGLSQYTILKCLKDNNIERRKKTYTLNEDYFSNIDTDSKSYLLGYLFADANIRYLTKERCYNLKLKIHKKDEHILEFLKKELCTNVEIKDEKNSNCSSLTISSKKMVEDLIKLGCTPKKSLTLKFPIISNKYYNSFIHGYFDGDGSIYTFKNQIHFKLLGTEIFLNAIRDYFIKMGVGSDYKVSKYTDSNVYQFRIFKKDSIQKIYNILYSNNNYIFLNRKKEIFNNILKIK